MSTFTPVEGKTFKLPNGELVDIGLLESGLRKICHYVKHTVIILKDEKYLVTLIFPDKKLFSNPDYEKSPEEGCFCPRNLNELGKCISGCLDTINHQLKPGYVKITSVLIINSELSVEDGTLTPALEVIPENVINKYKDYLSNLNGSNLPVKEDAFIMKLNY